MTPEYTSCSPERSDTFRGRPHSRRRIRRQPRIVNLGAQHRRECVRDGVTGKYRRAGQHLQNDHTETPNVGAFVHRLAAGLFAGHVRGRIDDHPGDAGLHCRRWRDGRIGHGYGISRERFGKSEVQHLHMAVSGELYSRRFQIAMNDAMLMRIRQASAICFAIGSASLTGIGPCAMRSARVGPGTSSRISASSSRP